MVKELASVHDFQLKKYRIYKRAIWLSNVTWKVWFLVKAFYKKTRMAHLQAGVKTAPSTTARTAPLSIPGLLELEKETIRNIYLKEEGWVSHTAMMLGVLRKGGRCRCFFSLRTPLDVIARGAGPDGWSYLDLWVLCILCISKGQGTRMITVFCTNYPRAEFVHQHELNIWNDSLYTDGREKRKGKTKS